LFAALAASVNAFAPPASSAVRSSVTSLNAVEMESLRGGNGPETGGKMVSPVHCQLVGCCFIVWLFGGSHYQMYYFFDEMQVNGSRGEDDAQQHICRKRTSDRSIERYQRGRDRLRCLRSKPKSSS
jgi:hypothetical protein